VWEIVDAIGSLLSAVLAGIAGFVAFKLYGIESVRDKEAARLQQRRDADARQQQAAAVGFWEEWGGGEARGGPHGAPAPVTYELTVSNHSNLPVYEVTISVQIPKTYADAEADVRAQLDEWAGQIHHFEAVLKPGTPVTVTIPNPPSANPSLGLFQKLVARVTLTFVDNAGVLWHRNLIGRLVEWSSQA
jgi:hypothetical protein